ncbi:MAG: hypothetical protein PUB86_02025 [Elusimicrobia bacterium]|nr:hypothetical protein [Elusimicrobiota bacterium]
MRLEVSSFYLLNKNDISSIFLLNGNIVKNKNKRASLKRNFKGIKLEKTPQTESFTRQKKNRRKSGGL